MGLLILHGPQNQLEVFMEEALFLRARGVDFS